MPKLAHGKIAICLLCSATIALSACSLPAPTEAELREASPRQLCQGYAANKFNANNQALYANELFRRKLITAKEWTDVQGGVIRTGMREHVAVCAWGPYSHINSSAGRFGQHNQIVIDDFGPYIYTENGKVTSWQQTF